jgi:PAS domain S-box-containing protein
MAAPIKSHTFKKKSFLSANGNIFEILFNSINDLLILFDRNGKIVNINNTAAAEFGRKSKYFLNKKIWELLPGDLAKKRVKIITGIIRSRKPYRFEMKQGNHWYDAVINPVFDDQGKLIRFLMTAHDITERKNIEARLLENEEKYRQLTETAQDIIFSIDLKGQLTYVNKTGQKISGYTVKELLKKNINELMLPEQLEIINKRIRKRIAGDKKINIYETEFINKAGMRIPIEVSTVPLRSKGVLIGILGIARDIRGRQRMEAAYKTLVEQSLLGIMVFRNQKLLYMNQAATEITGFSTEELSDMSNNKVFKMIYPDDRSRILEYHKNRMKGKTVPSQHQHRFIRKDGAVRWIQVAANFIEYQNEPAVQIFFIDITDQIETAKALKESEEKYRAVTETAQEVICITDLYGNLKFMNNAGQKLSGYSLKELLKMNVTDIITPEDIEMIMKRIRKRISGDINVNIYEAKFITKECKKIPFEVSTAPLRVKGELTAILAVARDIRERKRMEAAYKTIVEQSLMGIMIYREHKILFANEEAAAIFGYSLEELMNIPQGKPLEIFIPPEDRLRIEKDQDNRISGKAAPVNFIQRIIRKDGVIRWIQVTINRFEYQSQSATQVFFIDITDKIKAENDLKESEERYRSFLQHFRGIAYRGNIADWTFIFIHGTVEEITGYKAEYFIDQKIGWDRLIHPDDLPKIFESAEKIRTVSNYGTEREYRIIRKDKKIRWIYETVNNFCDNRGKPVIVQGSLYDITEKKQLEQELLKIQKLESIGILAGGIAHDFNNLLTGILGNITLANANFKPQECVYELLKEAENAAVRTKELAQQLLTFSRGGLPVKKTIHITKLIKDTARFTTRGTNIICKFNFADDLFAVDVDEGQIMQMINNIIINAIQAMPRGGIINIDARNSVVDADRYLPLSPGKYVTISVKDNGVGIPKEHIDNIFDPYFSTKQRGTGLGLTISYSIIKKHNGHISVESRLNQGAAFIIYLPASEKKVVPTGKKLKDKQFKGKGKILVMDDEDLILTLVTKILNNIGYQVETARDGTEAIAMYKKAKKSGSGYDAVILDLTVRGGMGGKETIEQLLQIDPQAKAIVSSGYSADPIMADYTKYGFSEVITKPYNASELGEVLKKVLGG